MYEFASSPDGRYYASLKRNLLTCCYEGNPFYKKELNYDSVKILGLANNANLIILADNSIILIPPDPKSEHKVLKGLKKQDLLDEQSVITALYINEIGTQICVGKMNMLTGIKSKIKTFFSIGDSKLKDTECHSLSFRSLLADRHTEYFDDNFDAQLDNKFCWHISKDFTWLALGKPIKAISGITTDIKLINIMERSIHSEHKINKAFVKSLTVNKEGTIVADTVIKNAKIAEILCKNNYRTHIEYDPEWSFVHLGNDYLVFKTKDNKIIAHSFDNKVLCNASLTPLEEMKVPYYIHFMEKKNLNIIEAMNDELKIVRTSIDLINTDSQRWTFIQKNMYEQKIAEEQQNTEKTARDILYQRKKAELAETINIKPSTNKKPEKIKASKVMPESTFTEPVSEKTNLPKVMPEQMFAETVKEKTKQKIQPPKLDNAATAENIIPQEIADQIVYNENLSIPVKNIDILDLYNSKKPVVKQSQDISDLEHLEVKPIIGKVKSLNINVPERRRIKPPQLQEEPGIQETLPMVYKDITKDESRQSEKLKIMKLVDMLDERFIHGEVTEAVYKELKSKYLRKIKTFE